MGSHYRSQRYVGMCRSKTPVIVSTTNVRTKFVDYVLTTPLCTIFGDKEGCNTSQFKEFFRHIPLIYHSSDCTG